MPKVPAPLFSPVYKNVQKEVVRDDSIELSNFFNDEKGGVERRPALASVISGAATPIVPQGVYATNTQAGRVLYSVANGTAFRHTTTATSLKFTPGFVSTSSSVGLSSSAQRVVMANDATYAFFADTGQIAYWNLDGTGSVTRIATSPAACSHVAFLDSYILANSQSTNRFYWSDFQIPLTWNALNFASALGDADLLLALHVYDRKIFLFGEKTLEVWENDGETPFSRVPGGFYPFGISGSHAAVVTSKGPIWLSNANRIVIWNGGNLEQVDTPFDRDFWNSRVEPLLSSVTMWGRECLLVYSPISNRSWLWDFNSTTPQWYPMSRYDSQLGESALDIVSGTILSNAGQCLVQTSATNDVLELSYTAQKDAPGDKPIRAYRVTGSIDYGTNARKRSNGIQIRLKRGSDEAGVRASGGVEPVLVVRTRDDGGDWSNEHRIGLGFQGERELIARLDTRGVFRTRQYEIVATDPVPLVYGYAEEDLEVMTS